MARSTTTRSAGRIASVGESAGRVVDISFRICYLSRHAARSLRRLTVRWPNPTQSVRAPCVTAVVFGFTGHCRATTMTTSGETRWRRVRCRRLSHNPSLLDGHVQIDRRQPVGPSGLERMKNRRTLRGSQPRRSNGWMLGGPMTKTDQHRVGEVPAQ
jgi:hypothetical protein